MIITTRQQNHINILKPTKTNSNVRFRCRKYASFVDQEAYGADIDIVTNKNETEENREGVKEWRLLSISLYFKLFVSSGESVAAY